MISLLATLAVGLLTFILGQTQDTRDEVHLRATVQSVVPLSGFSGKVTPVDADPKFALTLRVESVDPTVANFTAGTVVAFAIHSPALLFGGKAKTGKTYNFSVQRKCEGGKTKYFRLVILKVPDYCNRTCGFESISVVRLWLPGIWTGVNDRNIEKFLSLLKVTLLREELVRYRYKRNVTNKLSVLNSRPWRTVSES
jgi:hypothetical protein